MSLTYKPRCDYVLVRLARADKSVGGVVLPEVTQEGHRWYVEDVGPEVEDLEAGDRVDIIGQIGQDIAQIRNEKDLFQTKQSNVCLIIREED